MSTNLDALGETVAIFDKSGKVVKTSKHLLGIFREAQNAYKAQKAELTGAGTQSAPASPYPHSSPSISRSRPPISGQARSLGLADDDRLSRSSSRRSATGDRSRSLIRYGGGDDRPRRRASSQDSRLDAGSAYGRSSQRAPLLRMRTSPHDDVVPRQEMPVGFPASPPYEKPVDMDLAYGDFHEPSLSHYAPSAASETDMRQLVSKTHRVLIEAKCAQSSATATIEHLKKNPDALASVALTLAEISRVAGGLGPGVLAGIQASAPSVFALLASPQFLVAAGVGVGLTIVMLGGYKVVKQIKANHLDTQPKALPMAFEADQGASYNHDYYFNGRKPGSQHPRPESVPSAPSYDEMMELNSSVSRVEIWRRGVADVEAISNGTSVDGEFITPTAAAMAGYVDSEGKLRPEHARVRDLKKGGSKSGKAKSSKSSSVSSTTEKTKSASKAAKSAAAAQNQAATAVGLYANPAFANTIPESIASGLTETPSVTPSSSASAVTAREEPHYARSTASSSRSKSRSHVSSHTARPSAHRAAASSVTGSDDSGHTRHSRSSRSTTTRRSRSAGDKPHQHTRYDDDRRSVHSGRSSASKSSSGSSKGGEKKKTLGKMMSSPLKFLVKV